MQETTPTNKKHNIMIKTAFITEFLSTLNDQAAAEKSWNKIFWIEEPTAEKAARRGREAAEKTIRVAMIRKN